MFVLKKSAVKKLEFVLLNGIVGLLFSEIRFNPVSIVGKDGDTSSPPNKSNKSWLFVFDVGWGVVLVLMMSKSELSEPNKSRRAFYIQKLIKYYE